MKKLLWFVTGCILLVFLFIGLKLHSLLSSIPPDIKPAYDGDLALAQEHIPPSENAFFDLEKASSSLSVTQGETETVSEHLNGDKWDQAFVNRILSKNEMAISLFLDACRRKTFQDPRMYFSTSTTMLSPQIVICKLTALKGLNLWKAGRGKEGLDLLLLSLDLGATIQNSQVTLIQYMIALALTRIDLNALNLCLQKAPLPVNVLKSALHRLEPLNVSKNGFRSALICEYRAYPPENTFKNAYSNDKMSEKIWGWFAMKFFYKYNQSRKMLADHFRDRMADIDKPYSQVPKDTNEKFKIDPKDFTKNLDNVAGRILLSVGMPNFTLFIAKINDTKALLEMTKINFALHIYRFETGKAAESLSDLVPRYLPRIPTDPFDGKIMRYSKKKSILYSVGKNLTDVGGSEGSMKDWNDMDDPTLKIVY